MHQRILNLHITCSTPIETLPSAKNNKQSLSAAYRMTVVKDALKASVRSLDDTFPRNGVRELEIKRKRIYSVSGKVSTSSR